MDKEFKQLVAEVIQENNDGEKTRQVLQVFLSQILQEFRQFQTELPPSLVEIAKAIKTEFPKEQLVKVTNLSEIKPEKPEEKEKEEKISLDTVETLLKQIKDALKTSRQELKLPTDAKNPLAVRLSDGEKFIEQLTQVITQNTVGGGGSVPKVTVSGGIQAVPVVNPDGTNIAGGSGSGNGTILDGVDTNIKATVFDKSNSNPLATALVDANGDQITSFGGGTQYTEGDTDATITGTVSLMEVAGNTVQPIQGTVADGLLVNLGTNNDVTVTGTVTANLAAGTNNIGDVDVLSVTPGTSATSLGKAEDSGHTTGDVGVMVLGVRNTGQNTLAGSDLDYSPIAVDQYGYTYVVGTAGHDAADNGNPIKIGGFAETSLSGRVMATDADRVDAMFGVDGVQITRPHTNLEDIVTGNASNTDGTSTQVIASSGAGIKTYITDITITNTSSSNIYVELKDGTTVKWTFPVPANGGVTHSFTTPLPGTAATAWNFDPSAAASTVYCSALGFKSKI